MKEYKFISLKDKKLNIKYDYMLYCDSIELLIEHESIFQKAMIGSGINDLFSRSRYHANTQWRSAIETIAKIKEMSILDASCYLESKAIQGKLKALTKYGSILLRENGSYMILTANFEICDEVLTSKMVYPNGDFTIRIIKWEGGSHYYAKVGKFDVVDADGNQKWNSEYRAREEAEKFLLTL